MISLSGVYFYIIITFHAQWSSQEIDFIMLSADVMLFFVCAENEKMSVMEGDSVWPDLCVEDLKCGGSAEDRKSPSSLIAAKLSQGKTAEQYVFYSYHMDTHCPLESKR